eukprot:14644067-Heterocapsa_arctica.AAC.1
MAPSPAAVTDAVELLAHALAFALALGRGRKRRRRLRCGRSPTRRRWCLRTILVHVAAVAMAAGTHPPAFYFTSTAGGHRRAGSPAFALRG